MYIPAHFEPTAEDVDELLANVHAADLVTNTADGLIATLLPWLFDPPGCRTGWGRSARSSGMSPATTRSGAAGHR